MKRHGHKSARCQNTRSCVLRVSYQETSYWALLWHHRGQHVHTALLLPREQLRPAETFEQDSAQGTAQSLEINKKEAPILDELVSTVSFRGLSGGSWQRYLPALPQTHRALLLPWFLEFSPQHIWHCKASFSYYPGAAAASTFLVYLEKLHLHS